MEIRISKERIIGDKNPAYIIAEVGINHNGDFTIAKKLIEEAKKVGADAVKFQKRNIDEMYTKKFLDQPYKKEGSFGITYGEHKRYLEFPEDKFHELKDFAESIGITFLVSGFDFSSFDFIENDLNVIMHKIPSPFISHYPLLKQVALYHKPLILSTGMHSFTEILNAVTFIRKYNTQVILFQATTLYPCPDELANLNVLKTFRKELNVLVGYSSHDKGIILPVAAINHGACVIEKHFTLDRTMKGPDHAASVEPRGLELIIKYVRCVERGSGSFEKSVLSEEEPQRIKYGVSIVAKTEIKVGSILTVDNLTVKCPGGGSSPTNFYSFLGKKINKNLKKDDFLQDEYIEESQANK